MIDLSEELALIHYAFVARGFSWQHPKILDWLRRYHDKHPPKFAGEISPLAIRTLYRALMPITNIEILTAITIMQEQRKRGMNHL
jgi:hypothetical protein